MDRFVQIPEAMCGPSLRGGPGGIKDCVIYDYTRCRRQRGSNGSYSFDRNVSTRRAQGAPVLGGGSCVMRIGAEMRWHVSGCRVMAGIQVGARARRPVARCRLKETAGNGNRNRCRRRRHQVQLSMTVTGHEQLALVLVRRRIGRRRLRRGCQTLEIELVRVPLAVHLRHDVLVVIIPANRPILRSDFPSR